MYDNQKYTRIYNINGYNIWFMDILKQIKMFVQMAESDI